MDKQAFIDNFSFISAYTKDVLLLHYTEIATNELFAELESSCKNIVLTKLSEYNKAAEKTMVKSRASECLIQRIKYYYDYSQYKHSPKMRFTLKEYEQSLSLLSEEEKKKVQIWLEENGGFDKYVFGGYTAG